MSACEEIQQKRIRIRIIIPRHICSITARVVRLAQYRLIDSIDDFGYWPFILLFHLLFLWSFARVLRIRKQQKSVELPLVSIEAWYTFIQTKHSTPDGISELI